MTDFETHPAGTADLVKRLRSYQEFEQSRDGQIICVESEIANEAADHIEQLVATVEQLEANTKELGYFLAEYMAKAFTSDRTATELREALTRANAATAAAYEVAAREVECGCVSGPCQDTANCAAKDAAAIRALATPDQTAALDKLIAEAEARAVEKTAEMVRTWRNTTPMTGEECANAILYASKKGGV